MKKENTTPETDQHHSSSSSLDDEQRIKVLSPSMLVFKRFVRNRLAIAGTIIIAVMFLFSFVGALISPYGEKQIFESDQQMSKDYASAAFNSDYRFAVFDGQTLPSAAKSQMLIAVSSGASTYEADGATYYLTEEGEHFYTISSFSPLFSVTASALGYSYLGDASPEMKAAFEAAAANNETVFTVGGTEYQLSKNGKRYDVGSVQRLASASLMSFDAAESGYQPTAEFRYAAQKALVNGETAFEADGIRYSLEAEDDGGTVSQDGKVIVSISPLSVQAVSGDVFLTVEFKQSLRGAIESNAFENNELTFSFPENGEDVEYRVVRDNKTYLIKRMTSTRLISMYEAPSAEHWLGTDGNGMDILTRLMYGGQISLLIGFIVIFIETFIGVILGGISGYFGGWVDNIIMRLVDIFNCIPQYPILIIIGAIMDAARVDPQLRIYYLMLILGVLGWPGTARLVRGQILSLREQEFMTATEATGISVSRRIFKHLVPNVIPQLIVVATMGLGNIILTESTLSYLGLGVKFPYASWGNIISAVSTVYVMTNYWFVWIPAGMLILLTVLGFNFVGDGLRDAFDPKMKR
ncbi:MAG: ABC transporter permease [Firmicutes bacterium]|nr:ABC transporter permease [Bacillota bacterium]